MFGGIRPTLRFLAQATRPGGCVVVGQPFWKKEPVAEYLGWSGMARDEFGSHAGNVEAGEAEELVPRLALVSSDDEWDRYETLQWRAAARYADLHADDPEVTELLARVEKSRREYLEVGPGHARLGALPIRNAAESRADGSIGARRDDVEAADGSTAPPALGAASPQAERCAVSVRRSSRSQ